MDSSLAEQQRIIEGDHAIGLPFDYRSESARQVVRASYLEGPHAEAERATHFFNLMKERSGGRIVWLFKYRQAGKVRFYVLKQLDTLSGQLVTNR